MTTSFVAPVDAVRHPLIDPTLDLVPVRVPQDGPLGWHDRNTGLTFLVERQRKDWETVAAGWYRHSLALWRPGVKRALILAHFTTERRGLLVTFVHHIERARFFDVTNGHHGHALARRQQAIAAMGGADAAFAWSLLAIRAGACQPVSVEDGILRALVRPAAVGFEIS